MFRHLAAITFVVGSSATACAAEPDSVALSIDPSGAVIVPVCLNGQGPYPFLLDTGSSHTTISQSLAERLGVVFVAKSSVLTSTGREWRPIARIYQTQVGSAESEDLLASVVPAKQLDAIARGIEGIIGQDFLFGLNYTLDYGRRRLSWTTGGALEGAGASRLPLMRREGRYLVQVAAKAGGAPVLLVPDSGASGFVVFERNGRTPLALDPVAEVTSVQSLSGTQNARTMRLRELTLGPVTVRDQPVAVVERDRRDALEGDGLLPLHLFSAVAFNADENYIVLTK